MKVYISGPVTGLPDENREAFTAAARILKADGFDAVIPHDHVKPGSTWEEAMRDCIRAMMDCDAVFMLDGWNRSRGAQAEMITAVLIGIPTSETIRGLER